MDRNQTKNKAMCNYNNKKIVHTTQLIENGLIHDPRGVEFNTVNVAGDDA